MWYKIDFIKLAAQLLPPILRSKFLMAMLCAMLVPLRYLYGKFCAHKEIVDDRLNITGSVQYLEKALNDAFYLTDRQIYIVTEEEDDTRNLYFEREVHRTKILYIEGKGPGFIVWNIGEVSVKVNFIVMVPTFLCTDLDNHKDKYGGKNYNTIRNILNIYKPAGRTFTIQLYDYE